MPSHYIKREEESYSHYDQIEPDEAYQNNSSKIIRNKLGINKNLVRARENENGKKVEQQRTKVQTEQEIA